MNYGSVLSTDNADHHKLANEVVDTEAHDLSLVPANTDHKDVAFSYDTKVVENQTNAINDYKAQVT